MDVTLSKSPALGCLILVPILLVVTNATGKTTTTTLAPPAPLWPPITCHKWYDGTNTLLSRVNAECKVGTKTFQQFRESGAHVLVVDRKGCIAVRLGILFRVEAKDKPDRYFYETSLMQLYEHVKALFGHIPINEEKDFVNKLIWNGHKCNKLIGKEFGTQNSTAWGKYYECLGKRWGCGEGGVDDME